MNHQEYTSPNGAKIIIPVPCSYADTVQLIKSDYYRTSGHVSSIFSIACKAILRPVKNPLFWLRMSACHGFLRLPSKVIFNYVKRLRNLDIHPQTRIGYGFYIGHGIDMVVNKGTIIGNNVNLSQFLNIGTNHNTPAYICDEAYIGPMVCIIEDVTVGEKATVGAGAVVTRDVPPATTAIGVPAVTRPSKSPAEYIVNPWPL